MKKEEIRIRITPENVKEFIEVLRRNGESVNSRVDINANYWWNVGFLYIKMHNTTWQMYSTTLEDKQVTEHPSFNWTPKDLDEFLSPDPYNVCIKVTSDTIEKFRECLSMLGCEMFALADDGYLLRSHDGTWCTVWETNGRRVVKWTPDELHSNILIKRHNDFERAVSLTHVHERPYVPDEHIKSSHVVKNADGTASSVTLRDDKAVVEMPNGTLRIVDKSNLHKIV